MEPKIKIQDYTYSLPEERIAKYPLLERDLSKLLIYKDGKIDSSIFKNLPSYLPNDSLMVFNNTKVVPARLFFRKESGALIEIFCLEPYSPIDYSLSFDSKESCQWSVVIGNAKRWKSGEIKFYSNATTEDGREINLRANLISKDGLNGSIVEFLWDYAIPFSSVLEICGKIPIPPYLKRDTEEIDYKRYQTLYAKVKGSVAAPTAGLHFTEDVLNVIDSKGIKRDNICLHVGAGTFVPVKSEYISNHIMHKEPIEVTRLFIENLLWASACRKVVAVGTTSTRSLESLYYLGVHCIEHGEPTDVMQWEPYNNDYKYTLKESLEAILNYMQHNSLSKILFRTGIIIVPSYKFRVVDILITNFHQPQSTLLLLISAFIGEKWRDVYKYAMDNDFRFLSYGDSSLLFHER